MQNVPEIVSGAGREIATVAGTYGKQVEEKQDNGGDYGIYIGEVDGRRFLSGHSFDWRFQQGFVLPDLQCMHEGNPIVY
ncbi:MAG: hypothetical protein ACRDL7_00440 [Gaiellaceae bacterium]